MRVLHVVHQYLPEHLAGTELYTQMVAESQASLGHAVAVFTPTSRAGFSIDTPTEERGVAVYRVTAPASSAAAVFTRTFRHPELVAAFARVVETYQPDIINVQHLMGLPAGMLDFLVQAGTPYVITLHDYWYPCANAQLVTNYDGTLCSGPDATYSNCARCALARIGLDGMTSLLAGGIAPLMQRRASRLRALFQDAAAIFVPSPFLRDLYADLGFQHERVVVCPKGLDRPADLEVTPAREHRPASSTALHLGYLGSLSPQKGVDVLIKAVNKLPPEGVRLTLYGDTTVMVDYTAELRALARHPGIVFAGPVAREAVWQALANLDALVVPSLWYEAAPTTIREAFAVGLPVIASDLGTMPDLVRDGHNGRLFPPGDSVALAAILSELMNDPGRLQALAAGVEPDRPMSEHVAELLEEYEQVLGLTGERKG